MAIDKELAEAVNKAIAGDEQGFNCIYTKTYSYVFSRCRMIMKNDEDASELLQETYIAAYKSLDKLSDVNNIFAWLGAIAYNQGMKMFRKKKDILPDEDGEALFDVQENADISTMPGYEMELKEVADIVKNIIDELPETQRAVIMAYYYDEMSVNDIAQMMEVSAGTVKSRLNYARKHIEESVCAKEKQMGIRLHTMLAPILFTVLGAKAGAVELSDNAAKQLYVGICTKSGVQAMSALELSGAGEGAVSGVAGGTSEGVSGLVGDKLTAATTTAAKTAQDTMVAAAGKMTGITWGSTLVKTAVTLMIVGAGTTGVIYYTAHKDNIPDTNYRTEVTTEVMNNISGSTTETEVSITDTSDNNRDEASDDNISKKQEDDNTSEKAAAEISKGVNNTEKASDNTSENTSENVSTETDVFDRPDIEALEQEAVTTQVTTQAVTQTTTQAKTEKSSDKKQEVEFDDMEF